MKKIKWKNVIKLILFIICIGFILHDIYMLTIYNWVTGKLTGFTWFGLITFILFCITASSIYLSFDENKSATNIETVTRTNTFSQKYINSISQKR